MDGAHYTLQRHGNDDADASSSDSDSSDDSDLPSDPPVPPTPKRQKISTKRKRADNDTPAVAKKSKAQPAGVLSSSNNSADIRASAHGSHPISEYESERDANIARNKLFLASLEIPDVFEGDVPPPAPIPKPTRPRPKPKPKAAVKGLREEPHAPPRRSRRNHSGVGSEAAQDISQSEDASTSASQRRESVGHEKMGDVEMGDVSSTEVVAGELQRGSLAAPPTLPS